MSVQRLGLVTAISMVFLSGTVALAGPDFKGSIKSGEDARREKRYDAALAEFETAGKQAANATEIGLAMGKKAFVYAYDLKDYKSARETVAKALSSPGNMHAVAKVTLLQVAAEVQMKSDKDHKAAVKTLNEALSLDEVDWAKPTLHLMLGDAYRFDGQFEQALVAYRRLTELPAASKPSKAVALLNIGITQQYNLRDFSAARQAYRDAVELNPGLKTEIDNHVAKLPSGS